MKLALHVIAFDEKDKLQNIINNYTKYFDEVVIGYDKDEAIDGLDIRIVDKPKIKLLKYSNYSPENPWILDFAAKRNWLASQTESEWYFRLDTDDEISNPQAIEYIFQEVVARNVDVVYVPYHYSCDSDGNTNALHDRETIIRKSSNHYWKKPVHENIFVEDVSKYNAIKRTDIAILHRTDSARVEKSVRRDLEILLAEYERDGDKTDPRTLAYLGRMLLGFGQWARALFFLKKLVSLSGWDEDKYFAWVQMAEAYFHLDQRENAVSACYEAFTINSKYPDAYLKLQEIYTETKDFDRAIHWGKIGMELPIPQTMTVIDPTQYTFRPLCNMAQIFLWKGDPATARKFFDRAKAVAPNHGWVKANEKQFVDAENHETLVKSFINIASTLQGKEQDKIQKLIQSIPDSLGEDVRIQSLRNNFTAPKVWAKNSIVIYCFKTLFEWGPPSVVSGIGGSEEAVIYISKEFVKLGYDVTVYCHCGDFKGTWEGVTYKPFYEINPRDTFNILIGWRVGIFDGNIKAAKKIVWLHDVPSQDLNRALELSDADKILVLSEYHASLLSPKIPKEKIFVTTNGINLGDFLVNNEIREPHRCIYTSSYDRGLEHLLRIWGDVRKDVPDAELHIFYGWNNYDKFMEIGATSRLAKEEMIKLMDQPGVFEHGRVGHKKLAKELQRSKFWTYSSQFEEISCISAMKAQAAGCVPVCTDYAALKETVKGGILIKGKMDSEEKLEEYKQALIKALKEQPEISVDKEQFSWANVAKQWHEKVFS